MRVSNSTLAGERRFRAFWDAALDYQRAHGQPLWTPYPEALIRKEISEGLHYSVYTVAGELAGYFSTALADPLIWEDAEQGDAFYLHRMCVNPQMKGRQLSRHILNWACGSAAARGRKYVRMDTWGDNQPLVDHYLACGFVYLKSRMMGEAQGLPGHYKGIRLAMFQNLVG